MKCKFCGTETELFFCPNCGKIIEYPQFIKGNAKLEKGLADYVLSLIQEAKDKKIEVEDFVNKGSIAKEMFRNYYEHCLYLQELCGNKNVKKTFASNGVSLFDTMMGFAQKCNNNECQIAVVGTVKAGKSMFINAILGREIASSHPTPETASLTKFRYSPDGDYVKVTFYTEDEWKQLWKDAQEASKKSLRAEDDNDDFMSKYEELKADKLRSSLLNKEDTTFHPDSFDDLKEIVEKYTSCKYADHFFAKEVEVGLSIFDVPKNVVFVDTPGLDDPVQFRSDISRKYVNSANVILLCISADKSVIQLKELEQTINIFEALRYAKDRIYVFGTKFDFVDNFWGVWEESTKPEFVKGLSKTYLFGSEEFASQRIFPVSAYYYNLTQRIKTDENIWNCPEEVKAIAKMFISCIGFDQEKLGNLRISCEGSILELELKSNIPIILKVLSDGPIKDAENIITDDIIKMYVSIIDTLNSISDNTIKARLEEVRISMRPDIDQKIKEIQGQIEFDKKNNPQKKKEIDKVLQTLSTIPEQIKNNIKLKEL